MSHPTFPISHTLLFFLAQKKGFTILHYAGDVSYHVDSFVEKNRDQLPGELATVVGSSDLQGLPELFKPKEVAAAGGGGGGARGRAGGVGGGGGRRKSLAKGFQEDKKSISSVSS